MIIYKAFAFALLLAVVILNGFTDAPNAIAGAISSGAVSRKNGALISGIMNFLGALVFSLLGGRVAESIFESVRIGTGRLGAIVVCSSLLTVVIFATLAWLASMPSSESHALFFALLGASLAVYGGRVGARGAVLYLFYMLFSCLFGYFLAYFISKLLKNHTLPSKKLQILALLGASLMHGAQDGQKLLSMLIFIAGTGGNKILIEHILIIASAMLIGTALGGGKIVLTLSDNLAEPDTRSALFSDFGSIFTLIVCSLLGMPVSSSNIKASALIGSSHALSHKTNVKTTTKIFLVSFLTIPVCFLLGYLLALILLKL